MGTCIGCVHSLPWIDSLPKGKGNLVCSNDRSPAFHISPGDSCTLFSPYTEEADDEEPFPEEITVANSFTQEDLDADWFDLAQPNFD